MKKLVAAITLICICLGIAPAAVGADPPPLSPASQAVVNFWYYLHQLEQLQGQYIGIDRDAWGNITYGGSPLGAFVTALYTGPSVKFDLIPVGAPIVDGNAS